MSIRINIIFLVLILPLYAIVDYSSEIQPIFDSRCTNCHSGSDAEEDLSLTSYNNVMNGGDSGDVVIPYDHANSLLWQYINSGFMPPGTNDLTDNQVDLIARWINEGALEEPGSSTGCIDPEAYNCADDGDWSNYIVDVGGIMYDNSCNWDWNTSTSEAEYVGGCELGPCEGYYNPAAITEENNNVIRATRKSAYGDIGDQLDEIYKDIDAWKARIQSIKDANPKE